MPVDGNDSNDLSPQALHKEVPIYGWIVAGIVVVFLAGLGFYLYRTNTPEHGTLDKYVGPSQCKGCHPKQYDSWKQTRMANSFNVLRAGEKAAEKKSVGLDPATDYTHDANCLPCHTTGYGQVGGFVSIEKTPDMAGVTCESCHGHGGSYAGSVMNPKTPEFTTEAARKAGLVYPPTENVCRKCHNTNSPFVGSDYKFIFDERVKLGTHQHYKLDYSHNK